MKTQASIVVLLLFCPWLTQAFLCHPALVVRPNHHDHVRYLPVPLRMESSTGTARRVPKKSLQDRTQQEAIALIQDVVKAAVEAGPRAGPARTWQAYMAVTTTIQDFLPGAKKSPEPFSAPVALRKLFERMGATYTKLGQFVASSPTLFPAEIGRAHV